MLFPQTHKAKTLMGVMDLTVSPLQSASKAQIPRTQNHAHQLMSSQPSTMLEKIPNSSQMQ